ncbi:peptidoglycan editing factor PgeF, partial [Acidobacteriota bacterium]
VHGNAILYLWRSQARFETPVEADGLVTNQEGLILGVKTADCLPVLLSDPVAGCVAAIHAGWRGTVRRIASSAVECMVKQGGADPSRIRAALGPAVRPCCYIVGTEVIDQVKEALPGRFKEAIVKRKRLDLAAANRIMLEESGIDPGNIFEIDLCTCCNKNLFHSYRRDGKKTGRQIALIGIKTK